MGIFQDQPWSAQDERQAIGRVWRKPQDKPVTIVHLLGLDTTDTVMADGAYGKGELLAVFLKSPGSKGSSWLFTRIQSSLTPCHSGFGISERRRCI